MRIGMLFHKNPFGPPTGIDLIRLRALAGGLIRRGIATEIIAPVEKQGIIDDLIPVRCSDVLDATGRYDLIKTCYHPSILLLGRHEGPVVSRIVRVVDRELPERDDAFRDQLLRCQEIIRERASLVVVNNRENLARWREAYGPKPEVALVPTGCSREIPPKRGNPFPTAEHVVLFLGSVAAPRMVHMLNEASRLLRDVARVHLVGLNKACMYGGDRNCRLDPLIVDHGEIAEDLVWDYVRNASVGLALATGPHPFDNDVSKILNYLRGGLPVLSEEPILNNELVTQTGFGRVFRYGDVTDLVIGARELLENPMPEKRHGVMRFMAEDHSWDRRVDAYVDLFRGILGAGKSLKSG